MGQTRCVGVLTASSAATVLIWPSPAILRATIVMAAIAACQSLSIFSSPTRKSHCVRVENEFDALWTGPQHTRHGHENIGHRTGGHTDGIPWTECAGYHRSGNDILL